MFLSRRQFLKASAGTVAAAAVADQVLALTALQPVIEVGNPLGDYPDRSWERPDSPVRGRRRCQLHGSRSPRAKLQGDEPRNDLPRARPRS